MAKAFWRGVISFGMVAIPVKMYVAVESKMPGFHHHVIRILVPLVVTDEELEEHLIV